jgi:hypothetical protein
MDEPRRLPATVEITHRIIDGWHTFTSDDVAGLYLANPDYEKVYADIAPAIEQLLALNEGIACKARLIELIFVLEEPSND